MQLKGLDAVSTAQIVSIIISIAAFLVAAYGIIERRMTATRSERIRLTTIVENLTQVRRSLTELAQQGQTSGGMVEVVNTRLEVLSQQALSLVQQHSLTVTSTECREIAFDLELTGYKEDADFMWGLAQERAKKEGDIQELYASRGYAYFLFRSDRATEARVILQEALSSYPNETDAQRLVKVETLKSWEIWEIEVEGSGAQMVTSLNEQLEELGHGFSTPRGKAMFASSVGSINRESIGRPQP